jgi:hypothetical protein
MRHLILCENNKYYAYIIEGRRPRLLGGYETLQEAEQACEKILSKDFIYTNRQEYDVDPMTPSRKYKSSVNKNNTGKQTNKIERRHT